MPGGSGPRTCPYETWPGVRPADLSLVAEEADFLAALAGEEVMAVDELHPVAARAHDQRVRPRAVGEEPDAAEEVARRDARGGEDHVARSQVLEGEDAVHVLDPDLGSLRDLAPRRRPQLRLQLAAEAPQGGCGEHRLTRAADADRQMVVRPADRRRDRRGHVAVGDQLDPRAGGADLLDQVVVTGPVEDDRRDVVHRPP